MNRVDVVDLVVDLVDVDLVDVDRDVDLVDVDRVDAALADISRIDNEFGVSDFLVLKNAAQRTSQYLKWTSRARVLTCIICHNSFVTTV